MKRQIAQLLFAAAIFLALITPAAAGVDSYQATFTLPLGSSTGVTTMTLAGSEIKDVFLWCPTLDASDIATATLTQEILGVDSVAPRGWTDKLIGATADNAIIRCNTDALEIYSDGNVTLQVDTSTTQAAARSFKVLFVVKH